LILKKLAIKDFRQFRSLQQIVFSNDDDDENKNVTVILGQNGRGKTGIFRAVMFCLYGERRLSQDEEIAVEEIFLVNSAAMQDCAADPKNPVEAYVELSFEHKSEAYQITRKILGMFDGKRRIEQIDKVLLSHWKSDGNIETFTDPDEISRVVNGILDSNVRE